MNEITRDFVSKGNFSYYRTGLLAEPIMLKKEWLQKVISKNIKDLDIRINYLLGETGENEKVFDIPQNPELYTFGIGKDKKYVLFDLDKNICFYIDSNRNIIVKLIQKDYYYKYTEAYDFGKDRFIGFKRIPEAVYNRLVCITDVNELAVNDDSFKETESGIIVPDKRVIKTNFSGHAAVHEVNYTHAIIVSVGKGEVNRVRSVDTKDKEYLPIDFKLLDKVIIPPNAGSFIYIDDKEYRVCTDWDILVRL